MQHKKSISLSTAYALKTVKELDRSIAMHHQWLKDFHRMIICNEQIDPALAVSDGHLKCDFGRWYATLPDEVFAQEESIRQLAAPHKLMHDNASALLLTLSAGATERQNAYEAFINSALDFKLAIRSCQTQLIQRVCTVDHLTGAWNRHSMEARLREEAERVSRGSQTSSIAIVDIDFFKNVNDRYGHIAGDKALSQFAHFLMEHLRAYDITFRYGGEEFLICLPDTSLRDSETLLNRICEDLRIFDIEIGGKQTIRITASFGLTLMSSGEEIANAIERADHALLDAKQQGRNRVCVW